jgi:membrane protease YdiL (CAAX protease family)
MMNCRGIFANRSAGFQLLLLLAGMMTGAILSSVLYLITSGPAGGIDPGGLRMHQLVSSVLTFLFPSLLVAFLCSNDPLGDLSMRRLPDPETLLLTLISMFLLMPTITFTSVINKAIRLPAFTEPVENWMQSMEANAEYLTDILLSHSDWVSVLMNLFVIALMAAITEEFLFRGALQRLVGKWMANPHVVIWVVAVLFSAFHLQFYGFIPRLLLGAYFGYLLYWSGNIWIPVWAHFVNNAVAVIGSSNEKLKGNVFFSGEMPDSGMIFYAMVALVLLPLFFICAKHLRRRVNRL